MSKNRSLPETFYNPLSLAGGVLAFISFATIVFLTLIELVVGDTPAYVGILSYVVLPIPLIAGIVLFVVGVVRERRRLSRGLPASRVALTIDMNVPGTRRAVTFLSTGTFLFLLFSAYGSYRVFEWTESTEFCGALCHTVMEPEYTAYQHSPHARVACVDCHVGSGAGWYVRSKLSGAYQVYATLADVYPRPIPTPIQNLRPAQETCEQCHWPSHFAGEKKYVNTYFSSDEDNHRWTVALLMRIGGGDPDRGPAQGIHWHMNIANEIEYVATDSTRQTIPWVRARNKSTGEVTEYIADDAELSAEEYRAQTPRRMDCIDCHNRPSHIYRPPTRIMDQAMALGQISPALPGIRAAGIQVLVADYTTAEAAMDSIPLLLKEQYASNAPDVLEQQREELDQAIAVLQREYGRNFFPQMDVSWQAYPNNIGHMDVPGCFRCHDGSHRSPAGTAVSHTCNGACHTFLYQGPDPSPATYAVAGEDFQHPGEVGDLWRETMCNDCHSGQ